MVYSEILFIGFIYFLQKSLKMEAYRRFLFFVRLMQFMAGNIQGKQYFLKKVSLVAIMCNHIHYFN